MDELKGFDAYSPHKKYLMHEFLEHSKWGVGAIVKVENGAITVLFMDLMLTDKKGKFRKLVHNRCTNNIELINKEII